MDNSTSWKEQLLQILYSPAVTSGEGPPGDIIRKQVSLYLQQHPEVDPSMIMKKIVMEALEEHTAQNKITCAPPDAPASLVPISAGERQLKHRSEDGWGSAWFLWALLLIFVIGATVAVWYQNH